MVKKNKFWTPTKVIVTILIAIVLLFILFKLGAFGSMFDFLSVPGSAPSPGSIPISGGSGPQ